jgi:oxygen-independent coproporphyrinogen-3 oxidase
LIRLDPSHFSLYLLEIHDQTVLKKELSAGIRSVMQEEDQVMCYQEGIRLLQLAGFEHYEVSNFAKQGFQCRHNLKYWNGDPYEGFGMGACSYTGSHRMQNVRMLREYIKRIAVNQSPCEELIEEDRETRMRNRLIFGLRKREGVRIRDFEEEFGNTPLSLFGDDGTILLEEGLLELTPDSLRLSVPGMMISNEILSLVV